MRKENHVRAAGSLTAAIRAARAQQPSLPLIVEVETLAQLEEALAEGCERIPIDDFDAETRREAVRIAAGEPFNRAIPLEVSGGVDLPGLRAIAEDGGRSEEHTSELQSLMRIKYAVLCLKNKKATQQNTYR